MSSESRNNLGLSVKDYDGSPSTLCVGCGHDSISKHIIMACFQNGIPPQKIVKISGIGCSSKIPAYFMSSSFAFNSMHGRMASIGTGAYLAQKNLRYLGISGDGDTGNIGIGGFLHTLRRNVPMVYIIANNGVFGLTKGQFSASAEFGSVGKSGQKSMLPNFDFCSFAIEAGCGFVARSFSGDAKQMVTLIRAALNFKGTAVIDVISPCITFNNHDGSTKSYSYVKEHDRVLQEMGYFPPEAEIEVDYEAGSSKNIFLHDGSQLLLKKLDPRSHDVKSKVQALNLLKSLEGATDIITGLFYFDEERPTFAETLDLGERPLNELQEVDLKPSLEELLALQKSYQ